MIINNFRKFLQMIFLVFLKLNFLSPTPSLSQEEGSLKLILFTSPHCASCRPAKSYLLDKKAKKGFIDLFYEGEKRSIPLEVIDPFYLSDKELRELGLQHFPKIPYLGLFDKNPFLTDHLFLIRGHNLNTFSRIDHGILKEKVKKLGQSYFHIRDEEDLEDYKERMNKFFELNIPLLERILQTGIEHASYENKSETNKGDDPYPLSLEIGKELNLNQEELLRPKIIFIGNADNPFNNPLFTPVVLETIKADLETNLNFNYLEQSITLFGSGYKSARDVFKITENQETNLINRQPKSGSHGSFNRKNLSMVFEISDHKKLNEKKMKRLLIMVGHGAKEGALLWFEKEKLKKNELKALHIKSKSTNVMISGTCYGGQFYDSVSCGFFGAHPKTPAVGCWAYEDHIISKKDYTRTFFSSLNYKNKKIADFNNDGDLSLEEMHWYALLNGPKEDLPFTSIDGLARRFLRTYQLAFNNLKKMENYENLLNYATPGEKAALKSLSKDLGKLRKIDFQETVTKKLKIKSGVTLSLKINNLNPYDSDSIFQFSKIDRQKIRTLIRTQIQEKFKSGPSHISFKKIGPKILFRVFFRSGETVDFYNNFNWTSSGPLRGDFFEINLSKKEKQQLSNSKYTKFFKSKSFKILPKKWEKIKKEYTNPQLLKEFMRVSGKGNIITVGIKYKNKLDPWPKIKILGAIRNKVPEYRLVVPQIIKRLFFKKVVKDYPFYLSKFKSFQKCEQQKIQDFLN